ncbi:hypothetical protein AUTU_31650 [Aureibacter tunicatorum]|nr:hypothetical protein AUTU_31650 [Aureibacter tunicatorum]
MTIGKKYNQSTSQNLPIQMLMDSEAFSAASRTYDSPGSTSGIAKLLKKFHDAQKLYDETSRENMQAWADKSMELLLKLELKVNEWYSSSPIHYFEDRRVDPPRPQYRFWPSYYLLSELLEQVAEERRLCVGTIICFGLDLWSPVKKKVKPSVIQKIWQDILCKRGNIILSEIPEEIVGSCPVKDWDKEFKKSKAQTEPAIPSTTQSETSHQPAILPADQGAIALPPPRAANQDEFIPFKHVPYQKGPTPTDAKIKKSTCLKTEGQLHQIKQKEKERRDKFAKQWEKDDFESTPRSKQVKFKPEVAVENFRHAANEAFPPPSTAGELSSPNYLLHIKLLRNKERTLSGPSNFYWDIRADLARMLQQEETAKLLADIANSRPNQPIYIEAVQGQHPMKFEIRFLGSDYHKSLDQQYLEKGDRELMEYIHSKEKSMLEGSLTKSSRFLPTSREPDFSDTVVIDEKYLPEHPIILELSTHRIDESAVFVPTYPWSSRQNRGAISFYPSFFILMSGLSYADLSRKGIFSEHTYGEEFLFGTEDQTRQALNLGSVAHPSYLFWQKEMYPFTTEDSGDRLDPLD